MISLIPGDCLDILPFIPDGSVDLILTDPPYGTVKSIGESELIKHGMKNRTEWDETLDFDLVWGELNRVLRKNGKCILFSQEPFTSDLIKSAIPSMPFSYRCVWVKDHFANSLIAKKAPVNYFEDICVFTKAHPKHDFDGCHPLRAYSRKIQGFMGVEKKEVLKRLGQKIDHFLRSESTQFSLCTEETYDAMVRVFKVDSMDGFMDFEALKCVDEDYRSGLIGRMRDEFPAVFNLPKNCKYKSNIFEYKKDYDGFHPTQKPVALLEDLVRTYSNEGDTVLDFTMGSGSTGVACVNTNRNFIGIELDENYFEIAKGRILK